MLKIVIFDSGYGGEFFADDLAETMPLLDIVRVINWREAEKIQNSPRGARKVAEKSLKKYIGHSDLIIFANHLLTLTSLKYFTKKYQDQKFLGLNLPAPDTFMDRNLLILTTSAVARTMKYKTFYHQFSRSNIKTLTLDAWPMKIDDGELSPQEIAETLEKFTKNKQFQPEEIILACSQFNDIKPALRAIFGHNVRIFDSFADAIRRSCQTLHIRGIWKK